MAKHQALDTAAGPAIRHDGLVGLLTLLSSRVMQVTGSHDVGVLLADERGARILTASTPRTQSVTRFQAVHAEGPLHDCWRDARPVLAPTLVDHRARWPRFVMHALEAGFTSVLAVPLQDDGHVVGALNLFTSHRVPLSEEACDTVAALAELTTLALLQHRELLNAEVQLVQLRFALQSRIVIEQAKGIIAAQSGATIDASFALLRSYSRDHNRRLREVAREVIEGAVHAHDLIA